MSRAEGVGAGPEQDNDELSCAPGSVGTEQDDDELDPAGIWRRRVSGLEEPAGTRRDLGERRLDGRARGREEQVGPVDDRSRWGSGGDGGMGRAAAGRATAGRAAVAGRYLAAATAWGERRQGHGASGDVRRVGRGQNPGKLVSTSFSPLHVRGILGGFSVGRIWRLLFRLSGGGRRSHSET